MSLLRSPWRRALAAACVAGSAVAIALAESRPTTAPATRAWDAIEAIRTDLFSTEPHVPSRAAERLRAERGRQIGALLAVAKGPTDTREREAAAFLAIDLLGDHRAAEPDVVRFLVSNIASFKNGFTFEPGSIGQYRCAGALVAIGNPAAEEIMAQIAAPKSREELVIMAEVLRLIDGVDIALLRVGSHPVQDREAVRNNLREMTRILRAARERAQD